MQLPCVDLGAVPVGGLVLYPFGGIVAIGIGVGWWMMSKRAKLLGFDEHEFVALRLWALGLGFFFAHALDEVFYHPDMLAARPASIFFLWQGISSTGGIIGALLGAVIWSWVRVAPGGVPSLRKRSLPLLPAADVIVPCFTVAWIFGRLGCAIVHDHASGLVPIGTPLAVGFPAPGEVPWFEAGPFRITFGSAPRYDLGLLELFFTIILSAAILVTWRRRLPVGTYVAVVSLAYAPVRFALDFLRERDGLTSDLRWGAITFAQWACIALFAFGIGVALKIRRDGQRASLAGSAPAAGAAPAVTKG